MVLYVTEDRSRDGANGLAIILHEYDDKGNKIEAGMLDAEKGLREDVNGVVLMRFEYDEEGNKIRTLKLNKNSELFD